MSEQEKSSLSGMFESITSDFTSLIRGHIDLAKAELLESFRSALQSSALFLITFGLANFAVTLLLVSAGFGLVAAGLPAWAAFLIMGLVVLIGAVLCLWLAVSRFKKIRGPVKTIASINATTETIKARIDEQ
ncbi:MAG: phage holin family protein [Actinomycetes bacterium]